MAELAHSLPLVRHPLAAARRSPLWLALATAVFLLFIGLPLFLSILIVFARPQLLAWADVALPTWLRAVGAGMTLAAIPAAWWVFRSIGRNVSETILTKSDHQLVTIGPYRWIRHPLYATGGLLLLGVGLATANGLVLVLATIDLNVDWP